VAVAEGSFQTLASNRPWPHSLDADKDFWLEMEACDEGSVEVAVGMGKKNLLSGLSALFPLTPQFLTAFTAFGIRTMSDCANSFSDPWLADLSALGNSQCSPARAAELQSWRECSHPNVKYAP